MERTNYIEIAGSKGTLEDMFHAKTNTYRRKTGEGTSSKGRKHNILQEDGRSGECRRGAFEDNH